MNGLSNDGVEDMRQLFQEVERGRKTILLCSHNAEDIAVLCDEVYEMEKGEIKRVVSDQEN